MSRLNEDLVLEYLVENLDLYKKYPIKTTLLLDYCYKKNERIPQDYFSDFVSKVVNKQLNNSSKPMNIDKSNLDYCLFLESFKSLLSNQTKDLVKNAKTSQDFKTIIVIDILCRKIDNPVLIPSGSLESKMLNLVKAYQEYNLEGEFKKGYIKMKEYFLMVGADLRKPLTRELVEKFNRIKKELDEKLGVYSKYPNVRTALEIQNLVRDINKSIDNKLGDFICDVDQNYNQIKRTFEDNIWDNERRINRLVILQSELKGIKSKYQLVSHQKGIKCCSSLDQKIRGTIANYNYVKDLKEELKEVKRRISDYYEELDAIFQKEIGSSSIRRLNNIYSDLRSLSNRNFPDYVHSNWQEVYYSKIKETMDFFKQKCFKRVNSLADQSAQYRQKIDKSFFSRRTKRFVEKLEQCNNELRAWSECQII